jgi:phage shock protein PspC (stress-responsive transcriptional regulator)
MSQEESLLTPEEQQQVSHPKRHNLEPFRDSSKTRVLRFWLNVIFMLGAIAGLVVYFYADHEVAKYILIVASVFKFVELALRILKI